jgi:hypothetical protein
VNLKDAIDGKIEIDDDESNYFGSFSMGTESILI